MPLLLSHFHYLTFAVAVPLSYSYSSEYFCCKHHHSRDCWFVQQIVDTGDENQMSVRISGNTCIYLFSTSGLTYCVSENLKLHMASAQCKHIFFCAAGLPRHYATLDRHLAQTEKVTIITAFVVDQNIRRLGLRTVSFAKVFKASSTTVLRVDRHCA